MTGVDDTPPKGQRGKLDETHRDEEVDYDHPLRIVIGIIPPGSVTRIRLEGLAADAVAVMLEDTARDVATLMELIDGICVGDP